MRTMILLLDWNSTLFWDDIEGGRIDESTLPISAEMRRRLNEYYGHYSELYYQESPTIPKVSSLEKRLLDDAGLEIWRQLRSELDGSYRVLFYSEELENSFETPEDFMAIRKGIPI